MTYCVIFFIGYITFVNKEVSNLLAKHQRYILEGKIVFNRLKNLIQQMINRASAGMNT